MTRRTVSLILVAHLVVVWSAFVLRIDRFPLTWAPMYSTFKRSETLSRRAENQDQAKQGLRVTRRDGSKGFVGADELNISKWIMSRIYYQRAFGKGPVKHAQGNRSLGAFNRWFWGIEEGEEYFSADWERRLFWTLNKTLGHEPDDPKFIVKIRADSERVYYDIRDLRFLRRKSKMSVLHWDEEWSARWQVDAR